MVAFLRRQRLNLPLAPLAGGIVGALLALIFLVLPESLLEALVVNSGIASVLAAAEPPLGFTARAMLAMVGGGGIGAMTWFGLFLLIGGRTVAVNVGSDENDVPVLRRADAHPDAPARSPLRANRDLGTPFLDVRAKPAAKILADKPKAAAPEPEPVILDLEPDFAPEPEPITIDVIPTPKPLPVDLDIPLADYDPSAWKAAEPIRRVPPEPIAPPKRAPEPVVEAAPEPEPIVRMTPEPAMPAARQPEPEPVAPPRPAGPLPIRRPQVFDDSERFETFELTPIRRDPAPRPDGDASIHSLLNRLEQSVGQRESQRPAKREESLQDALAQLRELAQRRA